MALPVPSWEHQSATYVGRHDAAICDGRAEPVRLHRL